MFLYILLCVALRIAHGYLVLDPNSTILSNELEQRVQVGNYIDESDTVDWRTDDHVGPVKDQGKCEACWAFAITGTVESHASIHLKKKTILSEQFLIDCLPISKGCEALSLLKALSVTMTFPGGVLSNKDYYPYESRKKRCRWSPDGLYLDTMMNEPRELDKYAKLSVRVVGVVRVKPDEDYMALTIKTNGPIAAAINPKRMKNYHGNYIDEPSKEDCDPEDLTHTVTIVGYSAAKSKSGRLVKYWIIKNSWGTEFGDHGYYYLVRGKNACGIAMDSLYPVVADN